MGQRFAPNQQPLVFGPHKRHDRDRYPAQQRYPRRSNSTFVANAGPTYSDLKHGPVLPSANQPVTITVHADDPNGVASLTLFYSVEGGAFITVPMSLNAAGLYTANVPGQAAGASVQFYVQGQDTLGATSTFPAAGAASRTMYEVNDGIGPATPIESIRIVAKSSEAANMLVNTNIMSNQRHQRHHHLQQHDRLLQRRHPAQGQLRQPRQYDLVRQLLH